MMNVLGYLNLDAIQETQVGLFIFGESSLYVIRNVVGFFICVPVLLSCYTLDLGLSIVWHLKVLFFLFVYNLCWTE